MQDTLCGEETKGRIKKSQGHRGQPALPCPLSVISYPHTRKQLLSPTTEGLEAQMIYAALQRAICCPSSPSYFKKSCYHLYIDFFLNCRPIVLLPWNVIFPILTIFTIAPLSSHLAHTCPWLSKAIYLVSEACAMGLFGAQQPDTVLSIATATVASQYSSKVPEQVELKSWWLGNDVFVILI